MFAIDTGNEGSQGPWISWTSNGSAEKQFAPKSWVLRGKDDDDQKFEKVVDAFYAGCVMDLDTLKIGWEKDGARGMAPERKWNPSISQATPRPDESKKASGAYAWSRAVSVRVALNANEAATWEQGAFAAYDGFSKLAKMIEAQWEQHSQNGRLLPVVKQTGVEHRDLPNGSANVPLLEIVKWVERPAALKDEAPKIATKDTMATTQATTKVEEAKVPTDAEW